MASVFIVDGGVDGRLEDGIVMAAIAREVPCCRPHENMMKHVVLWGYLSYRLPLIALAKKLREQHGAHIHFICTTPQSVKYWRCQDDAGVIEDFVTTNHFFSAYDQCEESLEEICAQARRYEDQYGLYVVDALQADRHLGRGFSAAGPGHPRSKLSEKVDYVKSTRIFNEFIRFWETYFDRTHADLMIGLPGGAMGKTCIAVARHRKIPLRAFLQTKYQSYYGWADDEYCVLPGIRKNFAMNDTRIAALVTDEELVAMKRLPLSNAYYQEFLKYKTFSFFLRKAWVQCRRIAYQALKKNVTMGNYMLAEKIKLLYRLHRGAINIKKMKMIDPDHLSRMLYVFLALHVEPESSLGMQSPEMNEQMACIQFLAKNLPAGVLLVVKEHIAAIGRRPKEFYSTIADIPNVVMVSPHAYAVDVARKARAVATITGTVGAEAAILGIPVISFGLHNDFNILPHVHVVTSWTELRSLLWALCLGVDTEDAKEQRRKDGKKFLAALKASAMDLHDVKDASRERALSAGKEVDIIYASLMDSLHA